MSGHGFARENVARKENTGQNRQESELHGFGLRCGLAGDEDSERQRGEEVGQREKREQDHAAVNRDPEDENACRSESGRARRNRRQDREASLPRSRPNGRTGVTKSCSSVPRSFSRTMENAVRNVVTLSSIMAVRPGRKKLGERESGLKSILGRISTAMKCAVGEHTTQRFVEADGVADVDRLSCDGRVGAVDQERGPARPSGEADGPNSRRES